MVRRVFFVRIRMCRASSAPADSSRMPWSSLIRTDESSPADSRVSMMPAAMDAGLPKYSMASSWEQALSCIRSSIHSS